MSVAGFSTHSMVESCRSTACVRLTSTRPIFDMTSRLHNAAPARPHRPAGAGKTTTLRVLARELGVDILEWRNSSSASSSAYTQSGPSFLCLFSLSCGPSVHMQMTARRTLTTTPTTRASWTSLKHFSLVQGPTTPCSQRPPCSLAQHSSHVPLPLRSL